MILADCRMMVLKFFIRHQVLCFITNDEVFHSGNVDVLNTRLESISVLVTFLNSLFLHTIVTITNTVHVFHVTDCVFYCILMQRYR